MCFSAAASFGASAFLGGAGIVAIKKIDSRKKLAFACLPILFSIQQLSEGILWVALENPEYISWVEPTTYLYLFFAKVFWQIWIPYALWSMEPIQTRKKILKYLIWIGAMTSIQIIYLLFVNETTAIIENQHVRYHIGITNLNLHLILYFLATAVPFFVSSFKFMKLMGGVLVISLILSRIFFTHYVISVWCFFAAIISVMIVFIIMYNKETDSNSS